MKTENSGLGIPELVATGVLAPAASNFIVGEIARLDTSLAAYTTTSMAELWKQPESRLKAEVLLTDYLSKLSQQFPPDEIPPLEAFTEALDSRIYDVRIAKNGNDIIGGIHTWESNTTLGKCLEIPYLWVDAECRGQGLGKSLLSEVKETARGNGVAALAIEVADPKILTKEERGKRRSYAKCRRNVEILEA